MISFAPNTEKSDPDLSTSTLSPMRYFQNVFVNCFLHKASAHNTEVQVQFQFFFG